MQKRYLLTLLLFSLCMTTACHAQRKEQYTLNGVSIAFLADVHYQDIYLQAEGETMIRSMEQQVHSTRLFNENHFALLAALEDIAARGIKLVILPGDLTDDGQMANVTAIRQILGKYEKSHDIRFIAMTGNHDPSRPFGLPTKHSPEMKPWGYAEIMNIWAHFGFYPQPEDIYWESPFSNYNVEGYSFNKAKDEAALDLRQYTLKDSKPTIPDASFLVEPVPDLWVMALDASVHLPKQYSTSQTDSITQFNGSSVGYNLVLEHKPYLLRWAKKVCQEATKRGKTLITFSHYPLTDYNNGATEHLKHIFLPGKSDLHRIPDKNVSNAFADAGVRLHFGGHLHVNNTQQWTSEQGNTLINVQVPSTAGYMPAYKILTLKEQDIMEVKTVVLKHVPNFQSLFPLYQKERNSLASMPERCWTEDILHAENYIDYTTAHLKELVQNKILPRDFPTSFADRLPWIFDFYRLRNGGDLAKQQMGNTLLKYYKQAIKNTLRTTAKTPTDSTWYEFIKALDLQLKDGAPNNHFIINFNNKKQILKRID